MCGIWLVLPCFTMKQFYGMILSSGDPLTSSSSFNVFNTPSTSSIVGTSTQSLDSLLFQVPLSTILILNSSLGPEDSPMDLFQSLSESPSLKQKDHQHASASGYTLPVPVRIFDEPDPKHIKTSDVLLPILQKMDLVEWAIALHGMYESTLVFISIFK
jgi:hypothetical protein